MFILLSFRNKSTDPKFWFFRSLWHQIQSNGWVSLNFRSWDDLMRQPKIAFCTSKISRINSVLLFRKLSGTKKTIPERIWLTLLHVACGVAQNFVTPNYRYQNSSNVKIVVIMDHSWGFNRSETSSMGYRITARITHTKHIQSFVPLMLWLPQTVFWGPVIKALISAWRQIWDEFVSKSAAEHVVSKLYFSTRYHGFRAGNGSQTIENTSEESGDRFCWS